VNNYKGNNKVVNNMVFESTQNPAAREDFEATGSENFLVKHKKQHTYDIILIKFITMYSQIFYFLIL